MRKTLASLVCGVFAMVLFVGCEEKAAAPAAPAGGEAAPAAPAAPADAAPAAPAESK